MKLGVNKVKKVAQPEYWKKILIGGLRGIKCQKFRSADIFWYRSLEVSNFLYDARGK